MLVKENLFDKSKVEVGKFVNENDGNVFISSPPTHIATDFIYCKDLDKI